jgi:hypothetical protein
MSSLQTIASVFFALTVTGCATAPEMVWVNPKLTLEAKESESS